MAAKSPETSSFTETERKFEVVESTVTPSFDGLSSVGRVERSPSQSLDAVYFDTPGRDLARHRITLRRRTGGPDAGWHLKLPAGPDTRTEVRVPLEDDGPAESPPPAVPESLRDVVLAIVRDRPLAPVARISTSRTVEMLYGPEGSAVAEFCDDQVTASAVGGDEQQWREWELELAEGGRPRTPRPAEQPPAGRGSGACRARFEAGPGARPSGTAADVTEARPPIPLHRAVAEHVEELLVWDRAVRADAYDSVHQMRVTTRKIRSLLQSSEGSFGIADDEWILDELRALAGVLGVARDAEVLAERYEHALNELPRSRVRGPVRERLVEGAKRRYQTGWRRSLTGDALTALFPAARRARGAGRPPNLRRRRPAGKRSR